MSFKVLRIIVLLTKKITGRTNEAQRDLIMVIGYFSTKFISLNPPPLLTWSQSEPGKSGLKQKLPERT
jgi:hypothetical protein